MTEPRTPHGVAPVPRTTTPLADSGAGARLRVGFITHLDHVDDPRAVYEENLELIRELEALGYDSAWIATRHFHSGWAGLPSPFAFLGAAAARTSRIHLGTAVLPIIVDDPVRAAEEAAVADHLAGGRLQLGIGKGVPSDAYHVFSKWGEDRELDFDGKVDQLHWALGGGVVDGTTSAIWPANEDLRGRIYHGTSNWDTIRRAARLGDGFILERFGNGDERTPGNRPTFLARQAASILEYRAEFERAWSTTRTPHVVLSRSAWPGETTELALGEAAAAVRKWNALARTVGRLPEGLDEAGELLADNVIWGDPAELTQKLLEDPSVLLSDELVLGIHPGAHTLELALDKARILIDEVVPIVQDEWLRARPSLGEQVARHDALTGVST